VQRIEEACLRRVGAVAVAAAAPAPAPHRPDGQNGSKQRGGGGGFSVTTPAFYYFDEGTNTQVHELFAGGRDLKSYVIGTSGAEREREWYVEMGGALGGWLRRLHEWSSVSASASASTSAAASESAPAAESKSSAATSSAAAGRALRETVARGSAETRALKHLINFGWLLDRADEYSDILAGSREMFGEIGDMARAEVEGDGDGLVVLHGDFWTGK
jgi:hypothetical protein